jgi:hypothetical protein
MLREGDFLPDCLISVFNPDFGSRGDSEEIPLVQANLIIATQTCDLAHGKVSLVAKQYTRTLLFSTVYELLSRVVFTIKPSVHGAY